ncbi:MAG: TRAP transporter substrate-binding protein [Elusimicrobiota bacterium]
MKTRHQGVVAALVVGLLAGVSGSAHAAKYKIHWYLGHANLDYFEAAAADFKKVVETKSHGDISVEIVTAALDSAHSVNSSGIADKVEKGEIEMGHSFTDVVGGMDHQLYAFEAPYLFRGYNHMEGVFEGPVGTQMLEGLAPHHIVGLSFTYSGGASGVATVGREIRKPEDLKGLKVGVYGDPVNAAWLKSLGATPVAIEHRIDNVSDMARDGQLDAVVTTWRNFERTSLNKNFKFFNLTGSTYLVSMTYVNEKFFNSLPAEYRVLLMDASQEAGRIERSKTIELNESAKREMLGKGVRPVYLSEQGKAEFAKALQPSYKTIDGVIGKDLIEKIRKAGDGPHPMMPGDFASR